MFTSLQDKMQAYAQAFVPFQSVLCLQPFGWFESQLPQLPTSIPVAFIVVLQIGNPRTYSYRNSLQLSQYRIQFTIWAASRDQGKQIEYALRCFLEQTSFTGVVAGGVPQAANFLIPGTADDIEPQTQPPEYKAVVTALIFNNDSLGIPTPTP